MNRYADLEISLFAHDKSSYGVKLRYLPPSGDAPVKLNDKPLPLINIDADALADLVGDEEAYAAQLSRFLSIPDIRSALTRARDLAGAGVPLRLRLLIDYSAGRLHRLRWEMLQDADGPLFTSDRILFSRFIESHEPHVVRRRETLRCLAVFSNPTNLVDYPTANKKVLAPIDVEKEAKSVTEALAGADIVPVISPQRASIRNIKMQLADGYDILYLLCHGALSGDGEPQLWLEDEEGRTSVVDGRTLVSALRELRDRPTLVVLASCQSAGADDEARSSDDGVLSALGPRLAGAGIPAVIAMQGNVTMTTVASFTRRFFIELARDGEIDLAVARARSELVTANRPDWWVPALFMRLLNGRLWYEPGFSETEELDNWPAILESISVQDCTVLVGPDVGQRIAGTRREIAAGLASDSRFPLAGYQREDFPRVAQYIETTLSRTYLKRQILKFTANQILDRFGHAIPPALKATAQAENVSQAVCNQLQSAALEELNKRSSDPFSILARLPITRYITTQHHDLLEQALERDSNTKTPQRVVSLWNSKQMERKDQAVPEPTATSPLTEPTVTSPLVFHLFGETRTPHSVVLTEDDQLDFLIGLTNNRKEIPSDVRVGLSDAALIFLGFRIDSWEFLVLYRMIMNQEGSDLLLEHSHVAVQVDPQEWGVADPRAAAKFLKKYFSPMKIAIYWGSTDDFLAELVRRRNSGAAAARKV